MKNLSRWFLTWVDDHDIHLIPLALPPTLEYQYCRRPGQCHSRLIGMKITSGNPKVRDNQVLSWWGATSDFNQFGPTLMAPAWF